MFKVKIIIYSTGLLFLPVITSAAEITDFRSLVGKFVSIIDTAIPVVISLAVLAFLVGLFRYVWKGDNEIERQKGRSIMIWGTIGLFVMISIWGFVGLIDDTIFGIGDYYDTNPKSLDFYETVS